MTDHVLTWPAMGDLHSSPQSWQEFLFLYPVILSYPLYLTQSPLSSLSSVYIIYSLILFCICGL